MDVGAAAAEAAIRAEIAYYRAHLDEGTDPASLADLRARCAAAMRDALPGIGTDVLLEALLASLRFFAYPDAAPALRALRAAGIRTVVVSNWDWSLHERLAETGLAELVDGALASAEIGSAKPDGAIFRAALEIAGATAHEAWHVGDTPEADVEGARAAGLHPGADRPRRLLAAGRHGDQNARRPHTLGHLTTDETPPPQRWLPPVATPPEPAPPPADAARGPALGAVRRAVRRLPRHQRDRRRPDRRRDGRGPVDRGRRQPAVRRHRSA